MTCTECRDALNAFVDVELAPEEMDHVRAHLRACAACAEAARGLANLSHRLRTNLARYPAPDVLKARVRADIAAAAAGGASPAQPSRAAWATWARMAVVAGIAAVASSLVTLGV